LEQGLQLIEKINAFICQFSGEDMLGFVLTNARP